MDNSYQSALEQSTQDVEDIITNKETAENRITVTFDKLLDYHTDEHMMKLFWKLINYVETFDEETGALYRRVEELLNEGE